MPQPSSSSKSGLVITILFSAALILASLGYLGYQIFGDSLGTISKSQIFYDGKLKSVSLESDHLRGDQKAPISVIEYSDFQCPFCQKQHVTMKELLKEYGDKVNWVYRHYPLPSHEPNATAFAIASECAAEIGGNEKFWEFSDALFASQQPDVNQIAKNLNLDETKFQDCVKSEKYKEKITTDYQEGAKAGADGTPGNFIVNNKTGKYEVLIGAYPLDDFKKAIDRLLK